MNATNLSLFSDFFCGWGNEKGVAAPFALTLLVLAYPNFAFAGETLHVVERELTNTTIHVDAKGKSDSVGDMIIFANPIFDSANRHELGLVQGNCVRVIVGKSWECFFTLILGSDRVTLEGPYADTGESVFAITGGTGKYTGAKGQMVLLTRESKPGAPVATDMTFEIR